MVDLTILIPALGVLVVLTNIIVQVAKHATWDKLREIMRWGERKCG